MKKIVFIISLSSMLSSTIYENAEDKLTRRWKAFSDKDSTIKNIYDKEKKSRVIFLKSKDLKNGLY